MVSWITQILFDSENTGLFKETKHEDLTKYVSLRNLVCYFIQNSLLILKNGNIDPTLINN